MRPVISNLTETDKFKMNKEISTATTKITQNINLEDLKWYTIKTV